MSVNAISNARLALASLVHGVGSLRRARSVKDEPPMSGISRVIRGLLGVRPAGRVNHEPAVRDALARNKAAWERFERLMAQPIAPEEQARRAAWVRQTRLAMRELDELLSDLDPRTGGHAPGGAAAGADESAVESKEGGDE